MSDIKILEEGKNLIIEGNDKIFLFDENKDSKKSNKLFIFINYPGKLINDEKTFIYSDEKCEHEIEELKYKLKFNSTYIIDLEKVKSQKIYFKSSTKQSIILYYRYCTQKDIESFPELKEIVSVEIGDNKEKKKGVANIKLESPFSGEKEPNTKYSIYLVDGSSKSYKTFTDERFEQVKIIESTKKMNELEVTCDNTKIGHFCYVIAEIKDPQIILRPWIFYNGLQMAKEEASSGTIDNIINGILIILIIITFGYKMYKKKKLAEQQKANGIDPKGNPLA